MRKIALFFMLSVLLPLQVSAVEQWKEGEHYKVLDMPATKKPEIREYFSFWCPGCYRFEPIVDLLKSKKPDEVKFNKIHVNFMGFTGPDVQDAATKAMMVGRALKRSDEMNKAMFNYIHRQRGVITGMDDLKNIFLVNDVDPAAFDKAAASFGVNNMVNRNNKEIKSYRQFVTGVPNFIVNGKYQATFTQDMTGDDYVELLIWMTKLP